MVLAAWKSIPIKHGKLSFARQIAVHWHRQIEKRERETGTELQTKVNPLGSSKERERKIESNRLDRGKGK